MDHSMAVIDRALMGYVVYGLVLLRCAGLTIFAPFFGSEYFTSRARIGLALFLALVAYPAAVRNLELPESMDLPELGLLAVQETVLGLVLGFFASFVFLGAQLAGELVGTQIGFSLANVVDPFLDEEVPLIGFFQANLALLIFLLLGLHLQVIYILFKSYDYVGIGQLVFGPLGARLSEAGVVESTNLLVVAIRLGGPILLVMLLNSVVEGVVTRTMPQMNIMVLGMPLRVALGLLALLFVVVPLCRALEDVLNATIGDLDQIMRSLSA